MRLILLLLSLCLAACSQTRYLVSPPAAYLAEATYPDAELPQNLKQPRATLLYATDRLPDPEAAPAIAYSNQRSRSLILGAVDVSFGSGSSWDDLRDIQELAAEEAPIPIDVANVTELTRYPETPVPFNVVNGRPVPIPEAATAQRAADQISRDAIRKMIRLTGKNDILLFIHGVNNGFNDASLTLAELWHYTGRTTVPVLYSWPAGNTGLTGYFKDREAGEFTLYHLKSFLRMISGMPEVRNIHILAHSRGTDVMTTALRELIIETRSSGSNPKSVLKVENLILAAPDLDFGVASQRLIAEAFGLYIGQITVYINEGDSALGLSQSLMAGIRFGRIRADDIDPNERAIFARVKNVNFIDIEGEGGAFGHAYYTRNPAVLSDIGALINEQAKPGTAARPLQNIEGNFWFLPEEYP